MREHRKQGRSQTTAGFGACATLFLFFASGCATPREQALREHFGALTPEPSLAVSYRIWNGTTGAPASLEDVLARAEHADAIFFGEHHYERVGNALSAIGSSRALQLFLECFGAGDVVTRIEDDRLIRVHITGKQWWWDVRYDLGSGAQAVLANELRLPTDRPVELVLTGAARQALVDLIAACST